MRIALCAARFVNGDTVGNIARIVEYADKCGRDADMLCFGEAFVQGFDGLTWNYEVDRRIALSNDAPEIELLRAAARRAGVALGFGYMELEAERIYSSYMVISADGDILCNYRRMSAGWKVSEADWHYSEGCACREFVLEGRRFSVMLCGDLWVDWVADQQARLDADVVLWPVYTDFDADEWNDTMKHEYAERAAAYCRRALLVNCVCDGEGRAKGGAACFEDGKIAAEAYVGDEGVLIVEV